jgi:hypothetical protein
LLYMSCHGGGRFYYLKKIFNNVESPPGPSSPMSKVLIRRISPSRRHNQGRVARFFLLATTYQNEKKSTKWLTNIQNIPNDNKVYQMALKCINIFHWKTLQNLPKWVILVWKYTIWQPWIRAAWNVEVKFSGFASAVRFLAHMYIHTWSFLVAKIFLPSVKRYSFYSSWSAVTLVKFSIFLSAARHTWSFYVAKIFFAICETV